MMLEPPGVVAYGYWLMLASAAYRENWRPGSDAAHVSRRRAAMAIRGDGENVIIVRKAVNQDNHREIPCRLDPFH